MLTKNNINYVYTIVFILYLIFFYNLNLFNNLPSFSFSRKSIGIVIIFVLINFVILISYFYEEKINLYKVFFLWFLFLLPFLRFALYEIVVDDQSDPSRYYTYANQIIEYKTFNANPLNEDGFIIDQPLYRYYLIPFIALFGKLNYFFLFFNLSIYLYSTIRFIEYLKNNDKYKISNNLIVIYLFISSVYVAKNILSVQLEWLCLVLSFMIFLSYINKKALILFLLLGLLALQRQNFILVSLLISFFYIFENYNKSRKLILISLFIFIIILLLPLFHNYYYAVQEFKVRYFSLSIGLLFMQNPGSEIETFSSREYTGFLPLLSAIKIHLMDSYPVFKIRILEFIGIEIREGYTLYQKIFGILVCPMGLIIILNFFRIINIHEKIFLLLLIIVNIFPLFILGDGNWPRFQYLSYHSTILFISIWMYKGKNK
tara:strand:+ start:1044 stop:2333 length:1290 start_codon:yes stop_codon:yes gene_type:complete